MKRNLGYVAAAIAVGLALLTLAGSASFSHMAYSQTGQNSTSGTQGADQSPSFLYKLNKKYHDYSNGVLKVRAGAGGYVGPLTAFFPQHAAIKAGESVVFSNPTSVPEPHTVTFVFDNSTYADFGAPFLVGTNTTFTPLNPAANAQAITMPGPGGKTMIVGMNQRSLAPTVIDSQGKASYLPPNASYTLTGTEKYVNSGWIWPKGGAPQGLPPIDSFTVKFVNKGTYQYLCQVHPWMTGSIEVQ